METIRTFKCPKCGQVSINCNWCNGCQCVMPELPATPAKD